jgi:hypothetical protein
MDFMFVNSVLCLVSLLWGAKPYISAQPVELVFDAFEIFSFITFDERFVFSSLFQTFIRENKKKSLLYANPQT